MNRDGKALTGICYPCTQQGNYRCNKADKEDDEPCDTCVYKATTMNKNPRCVNTSMTIEELFAAQHRIPPARPGAAPATSTGGQGSVPHVNQTQNRTSQRNAPRYPGRQYPPRQQHSQYQAAQGGNVQPDQASFLLGDLWQRTLDTLKPMASSTPYSMANPTGSYSFDQQNLPRGYQFRGNQEGLAQAPRRRGQPDQPRSMNPSVVRSREARFAKKQQKQANAQNQTGNAPNPNPNQQTQHRTGGRAREFGPGEIEQRIVEGQRRTREVHDRARVDTDDRRRSEQDQNADNKRRKVTSVEDDNQEELCDVGENYDPKDPYGLNRTDAEMQDQDEEDSFLVGDDRERGGRLTTEELDLVESTVAQVMEFGFDLDDRLAAWSQMESSFTAGPVTDEIYRRLREG